MQKFLIKVLGPVITPLQNKAVNRVKEAVVASVFSGLSAVCGSVLWQTLGLEGVIDPKVVSIALGAAAAAFVNDVFTELRVGGTEALQKLLVEKYRLPVKIDDWFGPKTQEATEIVLSKLPPHQ
jgi:hypothetical protein